MYEIAKLLHLAAAIVWMGGMALMLWALRPALGQLAPPQRLPLLYGVLQRFLPLVWVAIGLLLLTGGWMLGEAARTVGMAQVPKGWYTMLGLGLAMVLVFGHVYFSAYQRLQKAVAAADWPEGGRRAQQLARLVQINFVLGWVAIVAVRLLR